MKTSASLLVVLLVCLHTAVSAQEAKTTGAKEAVLVSEGWKLLEEGNVARARERARAAVEAAPRSASAAELAVEVEIRRHGARAGLDYYEKWLGTDRPEAPAPLRRIARAWLQEASRPGADAAIRLEALRALAATGDPAATSALWDAAGGGGRAESLALAALGHQESVQLLADELTKDPRPGLATINALGESRNSAALKALAGKLNHPHPEIRASAAEAIGRIGGEDAVALLKPLLSDRSMNVKVRVAGALHRLNDDSGRPVLEQQLENSKDSAAGRLIAARAMAGRPDGGWLSIVSDLLHAEDPSIRLQAATLLLPHDPAAARATLDSLQRDANPAISEEAVRVAASSAATELPELRRMLRAPSRLTQVRAAGTMLQLTQ